MIKTADGRTITIGLIPQTVGAREVIFARDSGVTTPPSSVVPCLIIYKKGSEEEVESCVRLGMEDALQLDAMLISVVQVCGQTAGLIDDKLLPVMARHAEWLTKHRHLSDIFSEAEEGVDDRAKR